MLVSNSQGQVKTEIYWPIGQARFQFFSTLVNPKSSDHSKVMTLNLIYCYLYSRNNRERERERRREGQEAGKEAKMAHLL